MAIIDEIKANARARYTSELGHDLASPFAQSGKYSDIIIEELEPVLDFGQLLARYTFDSTSIADTKPGAGKFKVNNIDPTLATEIYVDNIDLLGIDNGDVLQLLPSGNTILFIEPGGEAIFLYVLTRDAVASGGDGALGYVKFLVTFIDSEGAFVNGTDYQLSSNNFTLFGRNYFNLDDNADLPASTSIEFPLFEQLASITTPVLDPGTYILLVTLTGVLDTNNRSGFFRLSLDGTPFGTLIEIGSASAGISIIVTKPFGYSIATTAAHIITVDGSREAGSTALLTLEEFEIFSWRVGP